MVAGGVVCAVAVWWAYWGGEGKRKKRRTMKQGWENVASSRTGEVACETPPQSGRGYHFSSSSLGIERETGQHITMHQNLLIQRF